MARSRSIQVSPALWQLHRQASIALSLETASKTQVSADRQALPGGERQQLRSSPTPDSPLDSRELRRVAQARQRLLLAAESGQARVALHVGDGATLELGLLSGRWVAQALGLGTHPSRSSR